ncbi:MAG TPA: hydrogenase formation protein HypD [Steroidobacteraceae bacterium]|nr:hydrogenase formation protein HypD [Steroidobacteraceae bacterium]
MSRAREWLERIRALPLERRVKILNVCGGHERSISNAGLRAALPPQVEIIPGPGCPVCICPEEDIYEAIQLARHEAVTLVAFGDMLRVPVNGPKSEPRSLEQAKAAGADIRPIASPDEAARLAQALAPRPVIFLAAGFETTTAPVAAMLAAGAPANLFVLLSGRRTWPIVAQLLSSGRPGFDAIVAPGHVATVMGPEEWQFVVDDYGYPAAVAGFNPDTLLAATYSVLRQLLEGRPFLDNCYESAVHAGGNPVGKRLLDSVMAVVDANWRGIGIVPASGFVLREAYAAHDARRRFRSYADDARKRAGQMPAGCECARVVLGQIYPNQCPLYGAACHPHHPIGPCMVSDEGACRIWWAHGVRPPQKAPRSATAA